MPCQSSDKLTELVTEAKACTRKGKVTVCMKT